ncbi:hypothetical protein [Embleya scabrispora]|uniref:hypothetical protein n=1 Tax=Embleya scabrispora TaxID=159449 RepID=UPI0003652318|nr:hypothetical protein [Embleya scabrispora]MYS79726.1 hypothetical protein [Streptomyces sp. SID5474]
MTIVRAEHKRDFVQVTNSLARDDRLEYGARGLAEELLSRRHVATYDSRAIAAKCRREGRSTIRRYFAQLQEHGYLRRRTVRDERGRLITQTVLCEDPNAADPFAELDAAAAREGEKRLVAPTARIPATGRPAAARWVGKPPDTHMPNTCGESLSTPLPTTRTCARGAPERASPADRDPLDSFVFPEHIEQAGQLLGELRLDAPRLTLGARDIDYLTPLAAEWLARGVPYHRVVYALTCGLPDRIAAPARLVEHRLSTKIPPADPDYTPPWPFAPAPPPRIRARTPSPKIPAQAPAPSSERLDDARCGTCEGDMPRGTYGDRAICVDCRNDSYAHTADAGVAKLRAALREARDRR